MEPPLDILGSTVPPRAAAVPMATARGAPAPPANASNGAGTLALTPSFPRCDTASFTVTSPPARHSPSGGRGHEGPRMQVAPWFDELPDPATISDEEFSQLPLLLIFGMGVKFDNPDCIQELIVQFNSRHVAAHADEPPVGVALHNHHYGIAKAIDRLEVLLCSERMRLSKNLSQNPASPILFRIRKKAKKGQCGDDQYMIVDLTNGTREQCIARFDEALTGWFEKSSRDWRDDSKPRLPQAPGKKESPINEEDAEKEDQCPSMDWWLLEIGSDEPSTQPDALRPVDTIFDGLCVEHVSRSLLDLPERDHFILKSIVIERKTYREVLRDIPSAFGTEGESDDQARRRLRIRSTSTVSERLKDALCRHCSRLADILEKDGCKRQANRVRDQLRRIKSGERPLDSEQESSGQGGSGAKDDDAARQHDPESEDEPT